MIMAAQSSEPIFYEQTPQLMRGPHFFGHVLKVWVRSLEKEQTRFDAMNPLQE